MLKFITVNYELIELLQFFWSTVAQGQKVNDAFIMEIAERPEMAAIYTDGFDEQSVRKVLSAVVNKEPVNEATEKELEFYHYNKFNADDPGNVAMILPAIKLLNLDHLKEDYKDASQFESVKVVFTAGYDFTSQIDGDTVIINYFKMGLSMVDFETIVIEDQPVADYVEARLREML